MFTIFTAFGTFQFINNIYIYFIYHMFFNLSMQEENDTATQNVDKENCDIGIINAKNCTNIDSSIDTSNTSHVKKKIMQH